MKLIQKEKIFCASTAPLLWKGLFWFIPMLTILFIVLVSQMLIRMYANYKKHKKLFDKPVKILSIWSSAVFLSLITYGIIGLDFNFYLLEFFLLTVFVLGAFFIGERTKLFFVARSRWIFVSLFSLVFAVFFIICFTSSVKEQADFAQGLQTTCLNRLFF